MEEFKSVFQKRLTMFSRLRKSHAGLPRHFRRLDSFARLLECDSICAAVYFDSKTGELWLATNQIHNASRSGSGKIDTMKMVFDLISNENLSIESILEKLSHIIFANFSSTKRYDLSALKTDNIDVKKFILEQLNGFFKFEGGTKAWTVDAINSLEYDGKTLKSLKLLIEKISRLVRDFLKLRDFLLRNKYNDPLAQGVLKAIQTKKFRIRHIEGKDVHAEMRHVAEKANGYIGISKLCCDHCALAMDAFGVQSRGVHGQRADWPIPAFIRDNPENLKKYVGDTAYAQYEKLAKPEQIEALKFVESKESNPINENAQHGRSMEADSSDSDVEFGVDTEDEDTRVELDDSPLKNTWWYRDIRLFHKKEFEQLRELGVGISEIIELYGTSYEKFCALTSRDALALMQDVSDDEPYETLSGIFDEDKNLFARLVDDENELAVKHGLNEVCDRYRAKARINAEHYNSDIDDYDSYDEVAGELLSENGWDYTYDSEDSENAWKHREKPDISESSISHGDDISVDDFANDSDDESVDESGEADSESIEESSERSPFRPRR